MSSVGTTAGSAPAAEVDETGTRRSRAAASLEAQSVDYSKADGWLTQTNNLSHLIYWFIHASVLMVFVVGAPTEALILAAVTYSVRVFGITGVYHRYFSHKGYKTSRPFQFVLALIGLMAVQKGPLWWASIHRRHHRYSDQEGDPHSPVRDGFWYAHQGWIFDDRWGGTATDAIRDFSRYPELVWLNKNHVVGPILLAVICWLVAGLPGLVWGFSVSTVALWHATYSINSLAHRWGTRRYETSDDSRNNWWLALLTFGEGWHNNHHHYMASARNGFRWWEVDLTYYVLRALAAVGLVWDLREPPRSVVYPEQPAEEPARAA